MFAYTVISKQTIKQSNKDSNSIHYSLKWKKPAQNFRFISEKVIIVDITMEREI